MNERKDLPVRLASRSTRRDQLECAALLATAMGDPAAPALVEELKRLAAQQPRLSLVRPPPDDD